MRNRGNKWQIAVPVACTLGEGPIWESRLNRLLWVDILEGVIHEWYPDSGIHRVNQFPFKIGAIAFNAVGAVIAATDQGFVWIDLDTKKTEVIVNPEAGLLNNRFNDGKCDVRGRLWAGTMDEVNGQPGAGKLYMLDHDGSVDVKIDRVTCSNGLAWNHDNKVFYYIDTPSQQVIAFDFEAENGEITNRRTVIQIPETEGLPDGMAIDKEGMLWIALWGGGKVARWNPQTGEKIGEIPLPVTQVTSCAFGGKDLNDLYITSAKVNLDADSLANQPYAGCLFVVKELFISGYEPHRFLAKRKANRSH